MKRVVKARINWTPTESGGRLNILPVGMRYCPIIVFESEQSGDTLWSIELYNTAIEGRTSVADISYLIDDAPQHLMKSGGEFLLYEGQRVVAKGVVA